MFYVYRLTHTPTGLFYIGRAVNPRRRFGQHISDSSRRQTRFSKFIATTHHLEWQLEILSEWEDKAESVKEETRLIADLDAYGDMGLNTRPGGKNLSKLQKQAAVLVQWTKENGNWNAGKVGVYSKESRQKMSEAKIGNTSAKEFHADPIKHAEWLKTMKAMGKPVLCHETGEIFASVAEVAARFNIGRCDVRRVCNGKRAKAAKHTFSWYLET